MRDVLFPKNFQQDDIAELEPIFFDRLICAFNYGDQHPLFSSIVWISSRIFEWPEYIVSGIIILFAVFTITLFFNFLEKLFNYNLALLGSALLISSPIFNTYTVGLKQYNFEIFTTVFCLWFYQKYQNREIKSKYFLYFIPAFVILFLLSFAAVVPIAILILFLFKSNKKSIIFFLLPIVLILPLLDNLLSKLSRVSDGGYWDNFFINTQSFSKFLESFYFLNQLFMKSIFPIFPHSVFVLIIFISLIVAMFQRNEFILFSFVGMMLLYVFSLMKFYPLGGGRTDLLFLPFSIILFLNFIDLIFSKSKIFSHYKIFSYIGIVYLLVVMLTVSIYYKNEPISYVLADVNIKFNSANEVIIVTEEQSKAFLYYSKKEYGYGYQSNGGCGVKNNIINLYISENFEKVEPLSEIKNYPTVVLIGIELPNTIGQLRIVSEQLIDEGYMLISEKTYEGSLKLLYFEKG
tara:strand:- start:4220 stop:5605 length:1386 start_codon:yes stop_codon:yes gene_type:complete